MARTVGSTGRGRLGRFIHGLWRSTTSLALAACRVENPAFDDTNAAIQTPDVGTSGPDSTATSASTTTDGSDATTTDAASTDTTQTSSASETTGDTTGDTSLLSPDTDTSGPPPSPLPQTYASSFAICSDSAVYGPELCAQWKGADRLVVDADDTRIPGAFYTFVAFDLGVWPKGTAISSLRLELRVAPDTDAASIASGEVWRISSFTPDSVERGLPTRLERIALDPGQALVNEWVSWNLPTTLAVPETTLYLGLYSTSDDGVSYMGAGGSDGPRLIVE